MIEINAVAFGLGAAISWGLYDYLSAKLAKRVGYNRAYFETSVSPAIIALLLLFATSQILIPTKIDTLAIVAIVGIVSFIGSLLVYKSFAIGKVSINSPISSLYLVVSIIAVALITQSTMSLAKLALGTITVLFSVFAAFHSLNLKEYKLEKGVLFAALAALCFTLTGTLPAVVKNEVHALTFALIIILITAICITALNWKNALKWIKSISKIGAFTGLLYLAGWIFYFYGINTADSVVTVAITGLFPTVPVILSALKREEQLQQHQKIALAAMFVFLVAFLLY
ncbi:MAG: EamA family transporter [Candidatus Micrarchaeota archaeon]